MVILFFSFYCTTLSRRSCSFLSVFGNNTMPSAYHMLLRSYLPIINHRTSKITLQSSLNKSGKNTHPLLSNNKRALLSVEMRSFSWSKDQHWTNIVFWTFYFMFMHYSICSVENYLQYIFLFKFTVLAYTFFRVTVF